ncbi:phosphoribosylaminoimidazole-succinocarboxamide synthase [Streptosporangium becharense]|uniref:Phosphoribosylaminoimidazole-succinocarboxamide synthase n=1 Tax=Streptosporangium becharense TaxID=1816182 RepID=A0A7W9IKS6_9ACTN|nr:phosphoribosylaminoimidazolesuccinocarboxamide synthase [Streptosporangium becharense]MBB2911680.1 phosphoribosylaminoimidazole-succinocarboxamide synthase [Streptosporangium becharense]MBB5822502.1 phosphoribosylaminoimidazole-succinocarboxamide synthase [Streptosporangium becharense]
MDYPAGQGISVLDRAKTADPDIVGRSKRLWLLPGGQCLVQIIPSLRSFTYERDELVERTGPLRLDFYEKAAARLAAAGVPCAFRERISADFYLADYRPAPPFEVIVKNRATGSTTRKYPGLFEDGALLPRPVVKFDYRCDPEDQPIGEDYLRALGLPVEAMRERALAVNDVLREWLSPVEVWDFCLIFGQADDGELTVISEISQDCMRLRHQDGSPLDKDLFRDGVAGDEIVNQWSRILDVIQ